MPKRRGIIFTKEDVSKVVLGEKLNLTSGRKAVYSGKIYLKPGNFPPGKAGAQRVFLKSITGTTAAEQRRKGKAELAVRQKLKAAGLPVSKSGLVKINGRLYLAVESFLIKGETESKLVPINSKRQSSTPYFLKRLTAKKNGALIQQLAKDTATIFNQGITPEFFDFFGFYRRKDGSLTRVIMDTENLLNRKPTVHDWIMLDQEITCVWKQKSKEMTLFTKTFQEHLSSNLANEFKQQIEEYRRKKQRNGWKPSAEENRILDKEIERSLALLKNLGKK